MLWAVKPDHCWTLLSFCFYSVCLSSLLLILSLSLGLCCSWLSVSLPLFLSQLLCSVCLLCEPFLCDLALLSGTGCVWTGSAQPKAGSKGILRVKGMDVQLYLPGGLCPPLLMYPVPALFWYLSDLRGRTGSFLGVMSSSVLLTIKILFGFAESTLFPLPHWPAFPLFISSHLYFHLHVFDRFFRRAWRWTLLTGKDVKGGTFHFTVGRGILCQWYIVFSQTAITCLVARCFLSAGVSWWRTSAKWGSVRDLAPGTSSFIAQIFRYNEGFHLLSSYPGWCVPRVWPNQFLSNCWS